MTSSGIRMVILFAGLVAPATTQAAPPKDLLVGSSLEAARPFFNAAKGTRIEIQARVSLDGRLNVIATLPNVELLPSGRWNKPNVAIVSDWQSCFVVTPRFSDNDLNALADALKSTPAKSKTELSRKTASPANLLPQFSNETYGYYVRLNRYVPVSRANHDIIDSFLINLSKELDSLIKDKPSLDILRERLTQ